MATLDLSGDDSVDLWTPAACHRVVEVAEPARYCPDRVIPPPAESREAGQDVLNLSCYDDGCRMDSMFEVPMVQVDLLGSLLLARGYRVRYRSGHPRFYVALGLPLAERQMYSN